MTKQVRPRISPSIARRMSTSVRVSTSDVASSKMRRVCRTERRARWSEAVSARPRGRRSRKSTVSYPLGSRRIKRSQYAARQAFPPPLSSRFPCRRRYSRTRCPQTAMYPAKPWKIYPARPPALPARCRKPSISICSRLIDIRITSVVLPAPVGPTIATFCPARTRKEKCPMSGFSGT